MSEVKVDKVSPRTGNYVALNTVGSKNILINGDMSIAQRGTSETGLTNGDTGYYTCDRWKWTEGGSPTYEFTMSQETDVPTGQGFANSLKYDCTTADTSFASSDFLRLQQEIEGQNLQYLKKGTSSAESLTVSFWVKSNKTGTYIAELEDRDNSRYISRSYTISSADTWEKKTITFEGDTSGTLDNDNGASLRLNFWLGAGTNWSSGTLGTTWHTTNADRAVGQVNLADNTANDWYITGVQLEAGTTASDFEFLPFDVNLQRCQRYYWTSDSGGSGNDLHMSGVVDSSGNATRIGASLPVTMRADPTVTLSGTFPFYDGASTPTQNSSSNVVSYGRKNSVEFDFNNLSQSLTLGDAVISYIGGGTNPLIKADAEL